MNEYFGLVQTKLKEKAPVVAHAANSLKLGTSTLAQLVASASGYSAAHIARRDNPHAVTPAQVGSYDNTEFNDLMARRVTSGIIPISRYGTLSYLPAGVSGSFDGATTVKTTATGGFNNTEQFSMQLEDNGTLSYLRNGTDGSMMGVYYGYVAGAAQSFVSPTKITSTSKRYEPPFAPAGQSVAYLMQGGQEALAGRFQDALGVMKGCFIALTNGTLDALVHTAVMLDASWATILDRAEVVRGKDAIFIIFDRYAVSDIARVGEPLDLELYTFPISAMDGVTTVTPTKVTIGQCTGFMGATYNTGNIRMAALAESASRDVPALVQHINGYLDTTSGPTGPGGFWNGNRSTWANGRTLSLSAFNTDYTKLRIMVSSNPRYAKAVGSLASTKLAWSCVLDMATLKATLDEGLTPMVLEQHPTTVDALICSGTAQNPNNGWGLSSFVGNDLSCRSYVTDTGLIFASRITYAPTGTESIYRGKWTNYSSAFEMIKAPIADRMPELRQTLNCPLSFGSNAGDGFDGFRLLPNNTGVLTCRNNKSTVALLKVKLRPTGQPLTPDYRYNSITYPQGLDGFKPGTDRTEIDSNTYRKQLSNLIQEMDDTGLKGTYGSVLANRDGLNSRYIGLNDDFTTTGTISATVAQLDALRDAIIVAAGSNVSAFIHPPTIEVIIPQNPLMPVFAVVSGSIVGKERWGIVARVTVSARSGAIASLTYAAILGQFSQAVAGTALPMNVFTTDSFRQGTYTIYELENEFMVMVVPMSVFTLGGGSVYFCYRFVVNKADGVVSTFGAGTSSAGLVGGRWGGFPGRGVGTFQTYDYTSKLVFRTMARTKAEFIRGTTLPDDQALVILSQQVAQGWVVYFTEDTPVIINGVAGTLSPTNIDLTTVQANPANSTFYVYVNMVNGVASYVIHNQYMAETDTFMYLGTVKTNDSGISVIDVTKVTKFAGFRLSTVPAGSSIPVTAGLPSREAHLDPTWKP
jgi:hypothetical protein